MPVILHIKYFFICYLTRLYHLKNMLTLRFHPGEDDFILQEKVEFPEIETDDDVLIKVEYAGLCGTDIHIVLSVGKPEDNLAHITWFGGISLLCVVFSALCILVF